MSRYYYDSRSRVWIAEVKCFGVSLITQATNLPDAKEALRCLVKHMRDLKKKRVGNN